MRLLGTVVIWKITSSEFSFYVLLKKNKTTTHGFGMTWEQIMTKTGWGFALNQTITFKFLRQAGHKSSKFWKISIKITYCCGLELHLRQVLVTSQMLCRYYWNLKMNSEKMHETRSIRTFTFTKIISKTQIFSLTLTPSPWQLRREWVKHNTN